MKLKLTSQNEYTVSCESDDGCLNAFVEERDGVDYITVDFSRDEAAKPPMIKIYWEIPHIDIQGIWSPDSGSDRIIPPVWGKFRSSSSAYSAPVTVLFSSGGKNRQTFACSDAVNRVESLFALREEDSIYECTVKLLNDENVTAMPHYGATIRVDRRDIRYEDALRDVSDWWAAMPEYEPMPVPAECESPVYSTWYSFHQKTYGDEIEEVLRSCRPLGFSSVIVDDGWQMEHPGRLINYCYCGDWEVCPEKIADMKAHVKRVHDMGMKYFLWYGLPLVGRYSRAYKKFAGKFLDENDGDCKRLDPRYPDVREYLISIYENAIRNWNIDGLKLDFVDSISQPAKDPGDSAPGRDYTSVPAAVDRLMTDLKARLTVLKPNLCIEFRQNYTGPLMRKYANMFRAADCPNDAVTNKVRTIDLHLLLADSPVHCDMLTWHPSDTVEAAALQLAACAFSVPQISVRPYNLPEDHNKMLKSWLDFWKTNRRTLLHGKFRAHNPELLYSQASAEDESAFIAVIYANRTLATDAETDVPKRVFINGSGEAGLPICPKAGKYNIKVESCTGKTLYEADEEIDGIRFFDVPVAGRLTLTK